MANVKIQDLPEATALDAADYLVAEDVSIPETVKITKANAVATLVGNMQAVFDLGRTIVTTVAKGALALSSTEDVTLLSLVDNVSAGAQALLSLASSATNRTGPIVAIDANTNVQAAIYVDTNHRAPHVLEADDVTVATNIVRAISETSGLVLQLRRALLQFASDEDAAVNVQDTASGTGKNLAVRASNAVGASSTGGSAYIDAGTGTSVSGDINIGTLAADAINSGAGGGISWTHTGSLHVTDSAQVDTDMIIGGTFEADALALFEQRLALGGLLDPSAISGTTTDWNPTNFAISTVIHVDLSAFATITSMEAGAVDGEIKILQSVDDTYAFALQHDDGSTGTAGNRFLLPPGSGTITVPPRGCAVCMYDGTAQRWRLIAWSGVPITAPRTVSGTTDTPTQADHGRSIKCTSGSATTITIASMAPGTCIEFEQNGAGQVTLSGSGVTLHPGASFQSKTAEQYSIIGVRFNDSTNATVYGSKALA